MMTSTINDNKKYAQWLTVFMVSVSIIITTIITTIIIGISKSINIRHPMPCI